MTGLGGLGSQGGINYGNNCTSHVPYFSDGEYHLDGELSDLIDIGDYNYSNNLRFDMEGDDREIDGDEGGTEESDMGADEYDPGGQG